MAKRIELLLDGLDCMNCATKIENEILKNCGANANINFITRTLIVELEKGNEEKTKQEIIKIVRAIDSNIVVSPKENMKGVVLSQLVSKKDIIQFFIAFVLFLIGVIGNFRQTIKLVIFIASYLIIGGDVLLRAGKNLIKGKVFDENFLMSIATIGAFIINQYAEGVAVMLFYKVGETLQGSAVNHSRKSITELMDIKPSFANLKQGNTYEKVAPEQIRIGDIIIVKAGEKISLDGIVIDGNSMIDSSMLTGEALFREVEIGQNVLSGSININGLLTIEVTKLYKDFTVSKILDMVENAGNKKAPTEKFITKFARFYTPIVVVLALLLAFLPPLLIRQASFADWGYRALVFLVISCPCALVISIPLGFFCGIGNASKRGILIKGSNFLEALNNIETAVFDKTGTLTKGEFNVVEIVPTQNYAIEEVMYYASYAERLSNHPIAKSILHAYKEKIDVSEIENFEEIAGKGIKAVINKKRVLAGNTALMQGEGIDYKATKTIGSVLHIAVEQAYLGYIVIADELKEHATKTIDELKQMKIRTIMLTGDVETSANYIGERLGIDKVYEEMLPNEKVEKIEKLIKEKSKNKMVLYVGDGINDAPVLSRADIGIAMGGLGSDAAIEAADIILMTDEPYKILTAMKIGKRTRTIVIQNIILSLGIKAIVLLLGALGIATLWEAVFADVGITFIAVLNAMRALKLKE